MKTFSLLILALVLTACDQAQPPTPNPTPSPASNAETAIPNLDAAIPTEVPTLEGVVETVEEILEAEKFDVTEPEENAIEESTAVTEPGPEPAEAVTSIDEEPALSAEEQAAYEAEQVAATEQQAVLEAALAAETETPAKIGGGNFIGIDAGHDAKGQVQILEMGDDIILEFQGNFVTSPGPDLYVYLSQPQSFGPQSRKGADVSRMKLVSALTSTSGSQMYKVSKTDWEAYGANVVIWCRGFGYLFGYAPIN